MNFVSRIVRDAAAGVEMADDPAALSMFLQPGCAAAIWRRQTPSDVQSWLEGIDGVYPVPALSFRLTPLVRQCSTSLIRSICATGQSATGFSRTL